MACVIVTNVRWEDDPICEYSKLVGVTSDDSRFVRPLVQVVLSAERKWKYRVLTDEKSRLTGAFESMASAKDAGFDALVAEYEKFTVFKLSTLAAAHAHAPSQP